MRFFKIILFILLAFSCNTINQPKPRGYLALNYPKSNYNEFLDQKFPFSFEYNSTAKFEEISNSSYKVSYPYMKATIYLNYYKVDKNLDSLLNDAYKLPYKHIVKAIEIPERIFNKL